MNRLLLVEDNSIQRKKLKTLIESYEFVVDEAENYNTASRKIEAVEYDVIILDLVLPGGDGIDLLRSFQKKMALKTIIITANASIPSVVEAIRLGAVNYLEKPVEENLLISQINHIINLHKLTNKS